MADKDKVDLELKIDLPEGGTSSDTAKMIELECLVGTWRLRTNPFLRQIANMSGAAVTDISHRSGEHRIVLREDGTYTGYRDQWSFATSTPQGTLVTTIQGTDPGTWSTTENEISFNDNPGPATVTLAIEQGEP